MSTSFERWDHIEYLFDEALARPEEQRMEWLRAVSTVAPDIRLEVEQMLLAHGRARGVLDRTASLERPSRQTKIESGELAAGAALGPYEIQQEIGRGGMGLVYRAHDPRLDRFVALKILSSTLGHDPEARMRFLTEGRAASALDHPNVCTVYDVGEAEDGRVYLALAFYEGETLAQRLTRGALVHDEAVSVALQIARGLAAAHELGIVHRDIKPSNVMLTKRGEVKILDFGIAKIERRLSSTQPGTRVGTVLYMSPEQARGQTADARSDLWSLGVVLYEMLHGEAPFRGNNEMGVLQRILHDTPYRSEVAEGGLAPLLGRLLSKDAASRPSSAEAVARELEQVARGSRLPDLLPHSLTRFVGREREIAQATAVLKKARLLTLTGPAGAGKTRLALEVAVAVRPSFSDGVCFIPLANVQEAGLVPNAIAQTLGLTPPVASVVPALIERLQRDRCLLVLDNFEHVVAAAPVVARLLEACPGVSVLVTSRVVLRVSGEHAYVVSPLPVPTEEFETMEDLEKHPATALFLDRARAAQPGFEPEGDEVRAVAAICARLEGLPLAIELAAARVRLFPPRALQTRLEKSFDVLQSGLRDRPARHQTLRQAVDWSYGLMTETERWFFRQLGVFPGGVSLGIAERFLALRTPAPDLDPIEGLAALVDQSLVQRDESDREEPRFRMLVTIQEFARERLREADEESEAQRAHAQCFLELAEAAEPKLVTGEQGQWLDRLEREHDNIRGVLRWALESGEIDTGLRVSAALWRFWLARAHLKEGYDRMELLLEAARDATARGNSAGSAGDAVRARALQGAATLASNLGENEIAREMLEESLGIWRALDDKKGLTTTLSHLGWIASELTKLDIARAYSEEGLMRARELGEPRAIAVALNNLGWISNYRGEHEAATRYHEENLALRRRIGDQRGIGFTLGSLAWSENDRGNLDAALRLVGEAFTVLSAVQDDLLRAFVRSMEARIELNLGHSSRAVDLARDALRRWNRVQNVSGVGMTQVLVGIALRAEGKRDEAEEILRTAISKLEKVGETWSCAHAWMGLSQIAMERNDPGSAMQGLRTAARHACAFGGYPTLAEAFEIAAETESRLLAGADSAGDASVSGGPCDVARERGARLFSLAHTIRVQRALPVLPRWERRVACLRESFGEPVLLAEMPPLADLWTEIRGV